MAFDFSLIIANPIYLATLGLATCGWIILMAGCAAAKLTDVVWFIVMYHLFLIIAVTTVIATNSIRQYRLALLAFMTAGFALLVLQVDVALKTANLQSTASRFIATTAPALQAASAGGMFILMVLCVWMIIFGSEDDSYIGRTINSFSINKSTVTYPPNNGGSGLPASNGVVSQSQQSSFVPGVAQVQQPVQENLSTVVVSPNADYPYKAQALYEYQANPDDQNELSFAKGEVLDIADNKGKWWQARKADGSIGIAPSNYLQLI